MDNRQDTNKKIIKRKFLGTKQRVARKGKKKDLRGEEIGMRNKGIPTKRGIQIQVTVQMFLMNQNPCKYNHNSFRFTLDVSVEKKN